jgi:glycosyltransferase involved in cell wall biosynthesis
LDFERVWSVPKNTIATVYPAFDLERIKKRSHGVAANNTIPVICSVGRLTSQKDFSLLIRTFSIVRKVMPARLRIAGTGPEQEMLTRLINQLKLQRDVELLGFIEYAEELIADSDLFVMTSIWEGFPATLVEAMVLETPVVSVNCESGPAELIQDGINGALIEVRSPEIIAERIIFLLQNPEIRAAYSGAAKKTVQQYSLQASVSALEQLILGV